MWYFVSLFLIFIASAMDCLESLASEMTCYVSSGTSKSTQTHTLRQGRRHWAWQKVMAVCCVYDWVSCQETGISSEPNSH